MKALKHIPSFDGSEDIERWIHRFELAVELDDKEDIEAKLLTMKLAGPAFDTWSGLPEKDKDNAPQIKNALRKVYGMRRMEAWRKATSATLLHGENLDVFGEQIKKCLRVAVGKESPLETIAAFLFLDGLTPQIREQVSLQIGDEVTYFGVLEQTKRIWPSSEKVGGVSTLKKNQNLDRTQTTEQKSVRCFCCNREGHIRRNCSVRCFQCGRYGHKRSECSAVPLNLEPGTEGDRVPLSSQ